MWGGTFRGVPGRAWRFLKGKLQTKATIAKIVAPPFSWNISAAPPFTWNLVLSIKVIVCSGKLADIKTNLIQKWFPLKASCKREQNLPHFNSVFKPMWRNKWKTYGTLRVRNFTTTGEYFMKTRLQASNVATHEKRPHFYSVFEPMSWNKWKTFGTLRV